MTLRYVTSGVHVFNERRLEQGIPYTGPDRRSVPVPVERVDKIEERQAAIMKDLDTVKVELAHNTVVTNRVMEILEAPATFWAWCSRWGRRISMFAKVTAPIIAFLIALDQLTHVDVATLLRRLFGK